VLLLLHLWATIKNSIILFSDGLAGICNLYFAYGNVFIDFLANKNVKFEILKKACKFVAE
jgi:hypothetical protein